MKILICLDYVVLNQDLSINEVAVKKIKTWLEGGVNVEFITKRNKFVDLKKIDDILKEVGLDGAPIHKKMEGEKFQGVIEKNMPQLFIECLNEDNEDGNISARLTKGFKLKKVILNNSDDINRLPDLQNELKDYSMEEEVKEL